jgi:type IV fimbrial biogenesis protein FimT
MQVDRGFSISELIFTVAVVAILAAISIPMAQGYMSSYHLKQATHDIVSQMQLARIRAIKNRVRTVVVFSPTAFTPQGGGTFSIYEDSDNDWVQDAGEPVILPSTSMPRRVTLTSAVFDFAGHGTDLRSYCGFGPQGLAARNGSVYVEGSGAGQGIVLENSKNHTRTVWFWASGKTEIQ